MLRQTYRVTAAFDAQGSIVGELRWYRVPKGTPFLGFPSRMLSHNYSDSAARQTFPGELILSPRRNVRPEEPDIDLTRRACGPVAWFQDGQPETAPAEPLTIFDVPECCHAGPAVFCLSGDSIVGTSWGVKTPRPTFHYRFRFSGGLVASGISGASIVPAPSSGGLVASGTSSFFEAIEKASYGGLVASGISGASIVPAPSSGGLVASGSSSASQAIETSFAGGLVASGYSDRIVPFNKQTLSFYTSRAVYASGVATLTGAFTLFFRAKIFDTQPTGGFGYLVTRAIRSTGDYCFTIGVFNSGQLRYELKASSGGAQILDSTASGYDDAVWRRYAIVYEPGARQEIWVNGSLENSRTPTGSGILSVSEYLMWGGKTGTIIGSSSANCDARIFDVRLWDFAATYLEMISMTSEVCPSTTLFPSGPIGAWRGDEGSGDNIADWSGNGNHGVSVGTTWVNDGPC